MKITRRELRQLAEAYTFSKQGIAAQRMYNRLKHVDDEGNKVLDSDMVSSLSDLDYAGKDFKDQADFMDDTLGIDQAKTWNVEDLDDLKEQSAEQKIVRDLMSSLGIDEYSFLHRKKYSGLTFAIIPLKEDDLGNKIYIKLICDLWLSRNDLSFRVNLISLDDTTKRRNVLYRSGTRRSYNIKEEIIDIIEKVK